MSQTEQTYQQLQARIAEPEAQYQTLQESYDDEILLCVSILHTLVDDNYAQHGMVERAQGLYGLRVMLTRIELL